MGISLRIPECVHGPWRGVFTNRPREPGWRPPERVTINLSTRRLGQLLRAHQLHVEDFSCPDAGSRECIRRLLLHSLQAGEDPV